MQFGESYTKTRSGWVDSEFYGKTRENAEATGGLVAFGIFPLLVVAVDYLLVCLLYWDLVQEPPAILIVIFAVPAFWIAFGIGFYLMLAISEPIIWLKCRRWVRNHPGAGPSYDRVGAAA